MLRSRPFICQQGAVIEFSYKKGSTWMRTGMCVHFKILAWEWYTEESSSVYSTASWGFIESASPWKTGVNISIIECWMLILDWRDWSDWSTEPAMAAAVYTDRGRRASWRDIIWYSSTIWLRMKVNRVYMSTIVCICSTGPRDLSYKVKQTFIRMSTTDWI